MKPLTEHEIQEELVELTGWKHDDDKIWKKFEFNDFKEALAFIVRVGMEAEAQEHHPNLFNVYNSVSIGLQTHDVGNKVTQKDIALAKAIESI
ncbi:MAG: hypothetical protein BalsKO_03930 [Balneolaceae bacterium]